MRGVNVLEAMIDAWEAGQPTPDEEIPEPTAEQAANSQKATAEMLVSSGARPVSVRRSAPGRRCPGRHRDARARTFLRSQHLRGDRGLIRHRQPTAPSICSSIRRLSSSAYSIGSSRAIGSTKPRTMVAIASSSVMPRLMR